MRGVEQCNLQSRNSCHDFFDIDHINGSLPSVVGLGIKMISARAWPFSCSPSPMSFTLG